MEVLNSSKERLASGVLLLNQLALDAAKILRLEKALELLHQAEKENLQHLCYSDLSLITWNNLGMVYKKSGNLDQALKYFLRCAKMNQCLKDPLSEATLYLNLASIYSDMKKADLSSNFLTQAVKISDSLVEKTIKVKTMQIIGKSIQASNLLIQSKHWQAIQEYKKAWDQSQDLLGPTHELTQSLKKKLKKLFEKEEAKNCIAEKTIKKTQISTHNYRKTPSCRPGRLESLPKFETNRKKSAMSFTEKPNFLNYEKFHSESLYLRKNISKIPRKEKIQGFEKEKLENLNQLIEEVEASLPNIQINKPKIAEVSGNVQKSNQSVSAQVNISRNKENFSLRHRINRTVLVKTCKTLRKKGENDEKLAAVLKEHNGSELVPVPVKTKIRFGSEGLGVIFESKSEDLNEFIVVIQSYWRMARKRRQFLKMKRAAVVIQKNTKRFFVSKIFRNILKAVNFIQSVFRGHRVRKLTRFPKSTSTNKLNTI